MAELENPEQYQENNRSPFWLKEERELRYYDEFSIRLTERELSAAKIRISVLTEYANVNRSSNKEYNPEKSLFARYTAWCDDFRVTRDGFLQYPYQVLFEYVNENFIQNGWANALTKITASNLLTVQRTLAAGIGNFDPPAVVAMATENLAVRTQQAEELAERGLLTIREPGLGQSLVFKNPSFPPPEVLWKITSDKPDSQFVTLVEAWFWPLNEADTGEQDAPAQEQPESDSSNTPQPLPGANGQEPLPPEEESQQDPRSSPDDYASAPEFVPEPENPPGRFFPYVTLSGTLIGVSQIWSASGSLPTGGGCIEFLSRPGVATVGNPAFKPGINVDLWAGATLANGTSVSLVFESSTSETSSQVVQFFDC
jgi:hypothetical protein